MSKIHYIIMILFSFLFVWAFMHVTQSVDKEKYVEITVSAGDTLWGLAEQYKHEHQLSRQQFIEWVMKVNKRSDDQLIVGEKIVIPVLKSNSENQLVANKP
ncbi:cell division suppressor protein YneA [Anoxybacillus sp. LAT_35]|uniref:cell division suppressor protein YneA n=1 Tax=Anoxybacillus TaxID=150247 RepID=UPI001EDB4203|nr:MULTISPECIES: cell division suppressor protein YneA [Anoxybacillus]MCG5025120.1 cell division suppressor protein YneA [Anoxybacillus flavithermus]MCG6195915.1 cell division suppressor protein YneA [Anoxybacillus sp. LAT_38]MCG3082957.1 cell division suppressor protein YneA [Anoxybacillus sp. LAT27]MCG3083543.1 cell division suppressor protein YneA [Anoxybacillus sp. LAT27]MCG6170354.1 cell division suppressor protein YneA [Anoxybacillus sp. LAT_11]